MARKGENIYKRKDGRWEGRYIIGYTTEGKAQYKSWCYVKITDTLNLCFLVKSAKCTNWSHLFHGLLDNEPLMA